MSIYDDESYQFHDDDRADRCFLCCRNNGQLFVVRHAENLKMVHICDECMVNCPSDYMLDNTKPWRGKKG
ncbi:MAG: hypothetical protein JXO48_09760 [Deltaproteobacteria bacterium]|nr:hypothetical protein [Deltaproteobacteria bacterium]